MHHHILNLEWKQIKFHMFCLEYLWVDKSKIPVFLSMICDQIKNWLNLHENVVQKVQTRR